MLHFLQDFFIENSLKIVGQPGGKSFVITFGKSQMQSTKQNPSYKSTHSHAFAQTDIQRLAQPLLYLQIATREISEKGIVRTHILSL